MVEIKLNQTLRVVASSFSQAEATVRDVVRTIRPNANEEAVTNDLEREFATELMKASVKGEIETAFANDLRSACPYAFDQRFQKAASGLIAEVSWHDRSTEGRTGGDFGVVLVRPFVTSNGMSLQIESSHRRGLLAQAKKRRLDGKWGTLSKKQKALFNSFRDYGFLLLYRFVDARTLEQMKWQPCRRRRLSTVTKWLTTDSFPSLCNTSKLIFDLGEGTIGTSDLDIIESSLAPLGQKTLVIKIDWPDGMPPCPKVDVKVQIDEPERIRIHQSW